MVDYRKANLYKPSIERCFYLGLLEISIPREDLHDNKRETS